MKQNIYISVVIPCYNEKPYIRKTVESILKTFGSDDTEIIVVDDGSKDGSYAELESCQKLHESVRPLLHEKNQGKGGAIRTGVRAAEGEIIAFIDGDGEVDPEYLRSAVSLLRESDYTDIVIGNRYMIPNGYKTTAIRRLYSRVYQMMNWLLFALVWKDTQAGLKVFRSGVAKDLFAISDVRGYAFDIDILAHAHLRGLHVEEFPITQTLNGESTITKRHILQMVADTIRTYRHFVGEEWASLRSQGNAAFLFPFLARQIIAIPVACAAWLCAKTGLLVIGKMSKH